MAGSIKLWPFKKRTEPVYENYPKFGRSGRVTIQDGNTSYSFDQRSTGEGNAYAFGHEEFVNDHWEQTMRKSIEYSKEASVLTDQEAKTLANSSWFYPGEELSHCAGCGSSEFKNGRCLFCRSYRRKNEQPRITINNPVTYDTERICFPPTWGDL